MRPAVKARSMLKDPSRRVSEDTTVNVDARRNASGEFEMTEAKLADTSEVCSNEIGEEISRETVFSWQTAHFCGQRPVRRSCFCVAYGSLRTSRVQRLQRGS